MRNVITLQFSGKDAPVDQKSDRPMARRRFPGQRSPKCDDIRGGGARRMHTRDA